MLLLQNDGTVIWTGAPADNAYRTSGSIELPADLLDQQSDLIDRVFAFAFDVLGLRAVELRIRPRSHKDEHALTCQCAGSRSSEKTSLVACSGAR
jgi:hypothetical protein